MKRKLILLIILFSVILVSAHIYGLTFGFPSSSLETCPPQCDNISSTTAINCPEGYMEGFIETFSGVDITLSEPIQSCFSLTIHDPSHPDYVIVCGDVFVNADGNVESVECGETQP